MEKYDRKLVYFLGPWTSKFKLWTTAWSPSQLLWGVTVHSTVKVFTAFVLSVRKYLAHALSPFLCFTLSMLICHILSWGFPNEVWASFSPCFYHLLMSFKIYMTYQTPHLLLTTERDTITGCKWANNSPETTVADQIQWNLKSVKIIRSDHAICWYWYVSFFCWQSTRICPKAVNCVFLYFIDHAVLSV